MQKERTKMTGVWVVVCIVIIGVHCFLASEMSDSAKSKGHPKRKYFYVCVCLGLFGYLCIIALPDLKAREQREQLLAQFQNDKSTTKENIHALIQDDKLPPL